MMSLGDDVREYCETTNVSQQDIKGEDNHNSFKRCTQKLALACRWVLLTADNQIVLQRWGRLDYLQAHNHPSE